VLDLLGGAESASLLRRVRLLLVGYGTKMGLAPLHAWKPDTYGEAPSLVAGLMAGGLTSCAFLGVARITEVSIAAGQAEFVRPLLLAFGVISLVVAAAFMIGQSDLKRLWLFSVGTADFSCSDSGSNGIGPSAPCCLVNNRLRVVFLAVGNVVLLTGSASAVARQVLRRQVSGALLLLRLFAVTGSPLMFLASSPSSAASGRSSLDHSSSWFCSR
jgi:hydrogenase-4 component F